MSVVNANARRVIWGRSENKSYSLLLYVCVRLKRLGYVGFQRIILTFVGNLTELHFHQRFEFIESKLEVSSLLVLQTL